MSHRVVLISDIDNTIYNFIDVYGQAFRAMVHVLSKRTKVSEDIIVEQFRHIFQEAGSLDFRNLIRNLEIAKSLSQADVMKLISDGQQAYNRSRRLRLVAYQGMNAALEAIDKAGVPIIGFTNAPFYHAYTRLRTVQALKYFSGLVAWEGVRVSSDSLLYDKEQDAGEQRELTRAQRRFRFINLLEKRFSKPDLYGFKLVQNRFGDSDYFVLGDSLSTDLEPAAALGMRTMWAKYGTVVEQKNLDTILRITPWRAVDIKRQSDSLFKPDHIIERPDDLMEILPAYPQLDLPL